MGCLVSLKKRQFFIGELSDAAELDEGFNQPLPAFRCGEMRRNEVEDLFFGSVIVARCIFVDRAIKTVGDIANCQVSHHTPLFFGIARLPSQWPSAPVLHILSDMIILVYV